MKKVASLFILAVLLVACNNINAYNIQGKVEDEGWEGKQVTLLRVSNQSDMQSLDSVIIKNGEFALKGKVDTACWLVFLVKNEDGQPMYKDFYVEGALKFTIKGGKIRISGGPVNEAYQVFEDKYEGMTKNVIALNAAFKADPTNKELEKSFNEEYVRFEKSFRELALGTIQENITNPLGLHLFLATMSSLENKEIESILAKAGPDFLADPTVKMVGVQLEKSKKVGIGKPFVDLHMFKPDSSPVSLSEYAGKGSYVMVDFWASWCGPCIKELPNVLACYEKYHSKGFEVVGVSLDKDASAWKAAIRDHKLPWPQMSDLAGWQSQAVELYSFSGIPHTVLLDPQGNIIAKDLRGPALGEKLAELFGK